MEEVIVRKLPDGRLSRSDAAKFLGLSRGTLANWAMRSIGPRPCKVGGRVFYFLNDLEAFRDGAHQSN